MQKIVTQLLDLQREAEKVCEPFVFPIVRPVGETIFDEDEMGSSAWRAILTPLGPVEPGIMADIEMKIIRLQNKYDLRIWAH